MSDEITIDLRETAAAAVHHHRIYALKRDEILEQLRGLMGKTVFAENPDVPSGGIQGVVEEWEQEGRYVRLRCGEGELATIFTATAVFRVRSDQEES